MQQSAWVENSDPDFLICVIKGRKEEGGAWRERTKKGERGKEEGKEWRMEEDRNEKQSKTEWEQTNQVWKIAWPPWVVGPGLWLRNSTPTHLLVFRLSPQWGSSGRRGGKRIPNAFSFHQPQARTMQMKCSLSFYHARSIIRRQWGMTTNTEHLFFLIKI